MVVQHNMQAANASRMLNITAGQQAKSTEKLSSGYRINRAADDAAGLSISEKMRKQIKGLDRASTNAQDGVSAVQTAEGALTEVHSMLQRMNELAVQSANGTNSKTDRDAIQAEIDQLSEEIDRVSETTKFNETYLLKGTEAEKTETVTTGGSATFAIATGKEFQETYTLKANTKYYAVDAAGTQTALTDATSASDLAKYIDAEGNAKDGYTIYDTEKAATGEHGSQISTKKVDAATIKTKLENSSTGLMDQNGKAVKEADLSKYFDATTGVYKGGLYSRLSADNAGVGNTGKKGDIVEIGADKINTFVDVTVTPGNTQQVTSKVTEALELSLHVGADSTDTNKIKISIDSMSAKGIGIDGLKVDTEESATKAIDTITDAIQKVSDQRSKLGAAQNRLEHTIDNLDNVVENTTSAESRIRDTDMADEMVKYSKNNILQQAGQSMLAQANQSTQGVLSLLQ